MRPNEVSLFKDSMLKLGVTLRTYPAQPSLYPYTCQGLVSIYVATSPDLLTPPGINMKAYHQARAAEGESKTEKFFKSGAGMAVAAVVLLFILGVAGASTASKLGFGPVEYFRLSAERFSVIIGERFSTASSHSRASRGRASTVPTFNPVGGETEMADVQASTPLGLF